MAYLVLARKYRPQSFEDVVQQAHVTQTLSNAIETDRMAHAVLFSGPRGTGKTTVARILAKAMNCQQGPTRQPCNRCQACTEITAGNAADVFEIDGASNNSVDQVRELIDNIKYMPVSSRFKIYIIDEVHMLSIAAFNALLKTLEEPPAHVMFFFATTEPHKIPITILSRCQRHDFRRIDIAAICDHMKHLCQQEGMAINDESLRLIAGQAGGSMRDALSLLDQVLSSASGEVTTERLMEALGVAGQHQMLDFSAALFNRDLKGMLTIIDEVYRKGQDIKRFYADLLNHFRNLVVVKVGSRSAALVDLPADEIEQLGRQAESVPQTYLTQVFDALFKAEGAVKMSFFPRLALEMVLVKLLQTPPALSIDALIDAIDRLRNDAGGSGCHSELPLAVPKALPPDPDAAEMHSQANIPEPVTGEGPSETVPDQVEPVASSAEKIWDHLVAHVARNKPSLGANLGRCHLKAFTDDHMVIEVGGNEFHYQNIDKHRAMIALAAKEITGRHIQVSLKANMKDSADRVKKKRNAAKLRQQALDHPLVAQTLDLFNGKIVDVKIP